MMLRYGMNPHQAPAGVYDVDEALLVEVLSGPAGRTSTSSMR